MLRRRVSGRTRAQHQEMLEAIRRGAAKDALEQVVKLLRGWDFQPARITYTGNDVSSALS